MRSRSPDGVKRYKHATSYSTVGRTPFPSPAGPTLAAHPLSTHSPPPARRSPSSAPPPVDRVIPQLSNHLEALLQQRQDGGELRHRLAVELQPFLDDDPPD